MSNLCNLSFSFGLIDALSQEILPSDCSFFAISLKNDTWCCWKEECELISFVPALQNGIRSSVTAIVFLRISTSSMHQPHWFLWCGSTQRQSVIPEFTPGSVPVQGMLPWSHRPITCPLHPGLCQVINMSKNTTYPVVWSNKGLHCGSLISFILCTKLTGGGKAVNMMLTHC